MSLVFVHAKISVVRGVGWLWCTFLLFMPLCISHMDIYQLLKCMSVCVCECTAPLPSSGFKKSSLLFNGPDPCFKLTF